MRISYIFAVALAAVPTGAMSLVIDDFTLEGGVFDGDRNVSVPGFAAGSLTQSLSPLIDRTLTFDDDIAGAGLSTFGVLDTPPRLSLSTGSIFGGLGPNPVATVSYAFTTVLDVSGASGGFDFGTADFSGAGIATPPTASFEVVDADGNAESVSAGQLPSRATPLSFSYASFTAVDLSRIKSVTLSLEGFDTDVDGNISPQFEAEGGSLAPIPLPAGLPLLLAGAGALALLRRRAA